MTPVPTQDGSQTSYEDALRKCKQSTFAVSYYLKNGDRETSVHDATKDTVSQEMLTLLEGLWTVHDRCSNLNEAPIYISTTEWDPDLSEYDARFAPLERQYLDLIATESGRFENWRSDFNRLHNVEGTEAEGILKSYVTHEGDTDRTIAFVASIKDSAPSTNPYPPGCSTASSVLAKANESGLKPMAQNEIRKEMRLPHWVYKAQSSLR